MELLKEKAKQRTFQDIADATDERVKNPLGRENLSTLIQNNNGEYSVLPIPNYKPSPAPEWTEPTKVYGRTFGGEPIPSLEDRHEGLLSKLYKGAKDFITAKPDISGVVRDYYETVTNPNPTLGDAASLMSQYMVPGGAVGAGAIAMTDRVGGLGTAGKAFEGMGDDLSKVLGKSKKYFHTTTPESAERIMKEGFSGSRGEMSGRLAMGEGRKMAEGSFFYLNDLDAAKEFGKNFPKHSIVEAEVGGKILRTEKSPYDLTDDLIQKARNRGYVGIRGNEQGQPYFFIFEKSAVKPTGIVPESDQIVRMKSGTMASDLFEQAKKYKSPEEFVNKRLQLSNKENLYQEIRQLAREIETPDIVDNAVINKFGADPEITLYRGVNKGLRPSPFESDITSEFGRFWSPNKAHAELFVRGDGKMYEVKVKASDLLKSRFNKKTELSSGEVRLGSELQKTAVESPTKSQLTDIWNKAHGVK